MVLVQRVEPLELDLLAVGFDLDMGGVRRHGKAHLDPLGANSSLIAEQNHGDLHAGAAKGACFQSLYAITDVFPRLLDFLQRRRHIPMA
jgi:hypothetical protein